MRTIFTLTFFLSCLFSHAQNGSWEIFYPAFAGTSVAAKGNTILVSTYGSDLTVFDALGNQQFFRIGNSGLTSDYIEQTAIDAAGHWWVAFSFSKGFARFDGTDWQVWSITDAGLSGSVTVKVMRAAPDGSLYAGTSSSGVVIFQNGVWSSLKTSNSGLPSNDIRDITFDGNGNTYFATAGGLAITDGTNWTIHNAASTGLPSFNNSKSVAVTADGIVWVTYSINRFANFVSGAWTEYVPTDIGLAGGIIGTILYGGLDRLWLTFTNSISVLSGGNWTHYSPTEVGCDQSSLPLQPTAIATDGAGRFWTTACYLTLFDGQTWEQQPTTNPGLPGGFVFAISEDAAGNVWLGAEEGISKLDVNGNWSNFDPADFGLDSTFSDPTVYDILSEPGGDVWFGLESGELLRYDGAAVTLFDTCNVVFPDAFVRTSAVAPNGDRWFSLAPYQFFGSRLAKYSSAGEWSFFDPANSPLTNSSDIEAIVFEANGAGWLATSNDGLYHFDGAAWTIYTSANSGLPDDDIHDIAFAPDGALWACTEKGLARFDGAAWTILNTTNSGLPSNETYRIAFDGLGGMYVGYDIPGAGAQVAELRNGDWTELVAPGYYGSGVDIVPPFAFTVDSQNRLWFTNVYYTLEFSLAPVFRYDPMLTGTEEQKASAPRPVVFPNPSTGEITLRLPGGQSGEVHAQLRNMQGQLMHTARLSIGDNQPVSLNLGNVPTGIYWLTVVQGSGFSTIKVVRQ